MRVDGMTSATRRSRRDFSVVEPNTREPRERLRCVSGWFCSDRECGYQELARRTG
jgi:hypothetical protein